MSSAPASTPMARAGVAPDDVITIDTTTADGRRGPIEAGLAAAWDSFVDGHDAGSIFHTSAWFESVRSAFGHAPVLLTARRGGAIVGGLPLVRVNSALGGVMLISMPYAVYGGILSRDPVAVGPLWRRAQALAGECHAQCVDLRSPVAAVADLPVIDQYVTFHRPLPGDPDRCMEQLPRKARAAARIAAERYGLTASFGDHHLPTVWRLYCRTMRHIGSLNYPYGFFEALIRRTPGRHFVELISAGAQAVGGLVAFVHNGQAMPYFVGVDPARKRQNVYNHLYLAAMQHAVRLGCHTFDFGRSRKDNHGACAFKRNQGFSPTPLQYQRYVPPGRRAGDLTPTNRKFALARRIWPHLPGALTQRIGARLSRHIPG